MARITGTQAVLRGPINRDENLIAHSWYLVLVYGAIVGAIALLFWMFQIGAWSERRSQIQVLAPEPVVIQQAPAPSAPAVSSGEPTAEELDRRHSEYLRRRD